jgi:hypothetical protein
MPATLEECLDDLARRIDEREEQANLAAWIDFLEDRREEDVFYPPARKARPTRVDWPTVSVNQAIRDPRAMLLQQFAGCSGAISSGSGARMNVRCNFGTGIMPSLFGCRTFMMDEDLNVLPTGVPLGSADKVRALLDAGVPDIRGGMGGRVFDVAETFLDTLARNDVLARNIELYHPDVQGPMDVAEVVWGSDMFYAFHDDRELLKAFLSLVTDTYEAFMRAWYRLVGRPGRYATHWGMMFKGVLMLRNDSLMNLSPDAYVDFARPMDERLFAAFGGSGGVHFCGRGDHYISAMSEMKGLTAVAMSQPDWNDMETIYRNTVDKGVKLLGLRPAAVESARSAGRPLRGQAQCFPGAETPVFMHKRG